MDKILNEMQCAERLSVIAEIIERENWQHLYGTINVPELSRLKEKIDNLEEENKELKDAIQQIKIKSMALADMRKSLDILINAATSR